MKHVFGLLALALILRAAAQAQVTPPTLPRGKLAVLKGGTSDNQWPMITSRVAPVFVQVFDPVTNNQASPLFSLAMATNTSVPGSIWINHHAGSEGGGISRTTDRRFLTLEGYTGNILSPTAAKPSTDPTVSRGIVTVDAFANAVSVYSALADWFGVPAGSAPGTQDNPTGIASTDGASFWGSGNFAGVSTELSGTLFFNASVGPTPFEVQNYIQAAAEARIIGGTLYVVVKPGTSNVPPGGVYNFLNPLTQAVVPLPYDPDVPSPYQTVAFTNLFLAWGSTYQNIANFDMSPDGTVAYGADQTYGIVKFTNYAGAWVQAPYVFGAANLGTTNQAPANQGCFGVCVDFSGPNPVIFATTMENGYPVVNSKAGHQNQNRLIRIEDTGSSPGTNLVAQTLAVAASTNEFFGGVDFTPDLSPLIVSNPAGYATTNGGSAVFNVTAQCAFPLTYQWLQNSNAVIGATNSVLTLTNLTTATNGFAYQCVAADQYGSVTSAPAVLSVTAAAVPPVITSGTSTVTGYVNGLAGFAPVSATGTEPFTYQWYDQAGDKLTDGVKYNGSTSTALTISNLAIADSQGYYAVVKNSAGYASNLVDVLTVKPRAATVNAGEPSSVTTFAGLTATLTAGQTGATPPVTSQWYRGAAALTDTGEFSGSQSTTLTINPANTGDTGTNYYIVFSNAAGSVTSAFASVTVLAPPAHSSVAYSNQVYTQNFDSLPDPGGISVNSINNPGDAGTINGVAYSLANPFDFAFPIVNNSYVGGLGLSTMQGWYGVADTLPDVTTPDGISRFGAQEGDQSTGGVIDFGPDDVNGGRAGTNRALGLLTTSTTGSTAFALKLVNHSANTLNYMSLSFLGELWRNNSGARTNSFGYTLDNTATNFVLTSESISNATLVPALAFSFPVSITLNPVDGTQPSNQVNLAVQNLALSSPWQPGAALWLIWSMNYYGSGAGNGYAIDNLSFSASEAPILSVTLGGVAYRPGGAGAGLQFSFTSAPGASQEFTVWGTTNLALPFAHWQSLGHPLEASAGNYQFIDAQATNKPVRFYRVSGP